MSDHILQHIEIGILKLQLNRPEKKNALTHDMYVTLANALKSANSNRSIRAIYLTGTQDIFTAGNDISDFASNPPKDTSSPVIQFLLSLAELTKPLIVAANGPAVGVGTTLMLHSDFVILGEATYLQMPFVSLGLCPEAASSYLLPLHVGYPKTAEWLLLGNRFSAQEAKEARLINEILPTDQYQARALEIATQISELPANAVAASRALIKSHQQAAVTQTIKDECKVFYERLNSPEAKEAFTAFFQKRKPDFKQFNQ